MLADPYGWAFEHGLRLKRTRPRFMFAYNVAGALGFLALIVWAVFDWRGYKGFWGPYLSYFLLGLAPINVIYIGRNAIDIWRRFVRP